MARCEKHKKFGVDICSGCLYEKNQQLEGENKRLEKEKKGLKEELSKWENMTAEELGEMIAGM